MLRRVLAALVKIDLSALPPKNVEILVVDNDPGGQARSICTAASDALPVELHFVEETVRGISHARNTAVRNALSRDADFIAFIDDDDYPEPDWLHRLIEKQRETRASIVGGAWQLPPKTGMPEWLLETPLYRKRMRSRITSYGIPETMGTFNVLLSREILEELEREGPVFALELSFTGGGDTDLFIRAKKRGARVALANDSLINRDFEIDRLTLSGVLKRAFRFGCSTITMARRHGAPGQARRRTVKALARLAVTTAVLPFTVGSKRLLVRKLCRLSREAGIVYRFSGRRYRYYSGAS